MANYNIIDSGSGVPVKAWTKDAPFEDLARDQVLSVAKRICRHRCRQLASPHLFCRDP